MSIHENIAAVHHRIDEACLKSGRASKEVELMIVSKTFPPEAIREAADYPHRLFGENRVQEMLEKAPLLPSHLRWHLIGHLQSNKVRKILPVCEAIHSIDSLELARDVDRIAAELGVEPTVYLQVNIAQDSAKFGFNAASVRSALEDLLRLSRVKLAGLMTIPAYDPDPEKSRVHFAALRRLRDELQSEFGVPLPGLSMGMSGDLEVAIEEGATIVRVGSSVFGKR